MRTVKIEWDLDDGYGGIYPVKAEVAIKAVFGPDGDLEYQSEVVEMDGPTGRDGQELWHLDTQATEEAIWQAIQLMREDAERLGFPAEFI